MKKSNHILSAMRHHNIVFVVVAVLFLFGFWGLQKLNKDEFPQFTIRQGVIVAIFPGATAQEVEEQVTKPLERFLFTYSEINKKLTYSVTENGVVYVFAELRTEIADKDGTWSKIRHGLQLFKKTSLPAGVLEIVVVDDFGNTSSMLLAVESKERSPRELEKFAEQINDRLRKIPAMGNLKILGQQSEEIAVTIDAEKLSAYGLDQKMMLANLATQGFRTIGGHLETANDNALVQVAIPYQTEFEIGEQIIFADPSGAVIRLKDVAKIERRYARPEKYVQFDGKNCVIVSMEMYPGNNIVAFGDEVEGALNELHTQLPPDVNLHKITNQPDVVEKSVFSFLRDLLFSIAVVIAVMLLLFPLRTALVAGSGVPVCTAITLGAMYITGIELNTVTLAALIVVLGMIVDDSVIIIDGYVDTLQKGHSRWFSASESTRLLFVPMSLATISICGMFYPMTHIITGPLGDFVQLFPWTVTFALVASIFYAVWVIPYLGTRFIKLDNDRSASKFEKLQNKFFNALQNGYNRLLSACFRHPAVVLLSAFISVGLGIYIFTHLNVQMMPKAERNCFAVEIHLTEGSSLQQTAAVVDSLQHVLKNDARVTSVTAFVGCASPRFHATYSPQMAKKNYAQFIVNTTDEDATLAILKHYTPLYENHFPNAYVRFKQMDYQAVKNPVEVRFFGNELDEIEPFAEKMKQFLNKMPEVAWVHSNYDETTQNICIKLKPDEATRLGVTQTMLSLYLSGALNGQTMTSVWDEDYRIPVVLYTQFTDSLQFSSLENLPVPTAIPGVWVPMRQIADLEPDWQHAAITRHNSVREITVGCDLRFDVSQPKIMKRVKKFVENELKPLLPADISVEYAGLTSANLSIIPQIVWSLLAAILVLLVFLLYHFTKIDIAILSLSASLICLFGACFGLWLFQLDFSITAVLGLVSLIGIIVRNAIIMFEYAEQLRKTNKNIREVAFEAGKRRMRPIFLTSATTALGVVPMIVAQTSLWMPMGVVICFGTIFTLPMVVTVLPVAYWQIYKKR